MNRLYNLLCIFVCLTVTLANVERLYVNDKLIRLEPLNDDHLNYIRALEENENLDFWTEIISADQPVDVHIAEKDFDRYVSEFKQQSLPFQIINDNIQLMIDEEQNALAFDLLSRQLKSRIFGQERADIVGTYASYNDMVTFLQEKATADPSRVKVINIGQTSQGRTINAIQLSYNPSSTRNIWFDCGIHAREWITPATCIWIVDKLISDYANNDATVKGILDYWNVYVAPSLNPDGYEFSRTTGNRLWRKSRNANAGSTCIGVDLNRNYPRAWMTGGASNNPCSDTFAGRSAGSEIETVGVVNFLLSKVGTWDMYMSFHSYGQWWFTPYGYNTSYPADYSKQMSVAQLGANAITAVNNRRYALGTVSRLLYVASGSTVDWAYDVLKCRFSYTIELPPTQAESSTGFVLPPAQAPGVCDETYTGMKVFLDAVKKEVQSSSSG